MDKINIENLENKTSVKLSESEKESFDKCAELNLKVIEFIANTDTTGVNPYCQPAVGFDLLREDTAE